jgi:RNA polymerase sigma-70 factor (ECF subfamily)
LGKYYEALEYMFWIAVIPSREKLTESNDSELMMAVQDGKKMAFNVLVERYKKKAYYIALGLVGDSDEAYDLSQEAFIRIYNARKRYDRKRPFFSWFYAILSNLAKNHLKKRSVRAEYARQVKDEHNPTQDFSTSPDVIVEADETKKEVWAAIEKLSYDHREIIILRHFQDLPYDEIAKLLDIPTGSVMSRLYYARKKLREVLGDDYER